MSETRSECTESATVLLYQGVVDGPLLHMPTGTSYVAYCASNSLVNVMHPFALVSKTRESL
jgi:hypothetical protein